MISTMNDLIRQAAGITSHAQCTLPTDTFDDDGLGQDISVDNDQGQRNSHIRPLISTEINTRIRRACGHSIQPGQRVDLPNIGEY